jgi:hypothetical protein
MNFVSAFRASRVLLLLFWGVVALPAIASADPIVITSRRIDFNLGSGGPGLQPQLIGSFFFEVSTPNSGRARLFEVPVTPADVGRTFRVTSATDADFAVAAAALTDGIDAFHGYGLEFADGHWGTRSVTEGELFHDRLSFPDPDPDLLGFTLTGITARLDELIVDADSRSRFAAFSGELTFEGFADATVPEPGTLTLLGTAIALGARRTIRNVRGGRQK